MDEDSRVLECEGAWSRSFEVDVSHSLARHFRRTFIGEERVIVIRSWFVFTATLGGRIIGFHVLLQDGRC